MRTDQPSQPSLTLILTLSLTLLTVHSALVEDIRDRIVQDLGLSRTPDLVHANVSQAEYERMVRVYQQSVSQTLALRSLRAGSSVLVTAANLMVSLPSLPSPSRVRVSQVVAGGEISLDSVVTTAGTGGGNIIKLDVSHAVSGWLAQPNTNMGLTLSQERPENSERSEVLRAELVLETRERPGLVRERRQTDRLLEFQPDLVNSHTDCRVSVGKKNKCCRKKMPVNIQELEGFGFIYQPRVFDAAFCAGSCPPRYHPLNDHSLLQSLMHIKSRKAAVGGGRRGRRATIKNTCCTPAVFENLDILHLDERDPSKLRVTNWKNIIVSECACA